MTLKEKFKLIEYNAITWSWFYDTQVQIADDYAIEFADWVDNIRVDRKILYDTSSIKQLLETFKNEKGL